MPKEKETPKKRPEVKWGKCENCGYKGPVGKNGCPKCNADYWWHELWHEKK